MAIIHLSKALGAFIKRTLRNDGLASVVVSSSGIIYPSRDVTIHATRVDTPDAEESAVWHTVTSFPALCEAEQITVTEDGVTATTGVRTTELDAMPTEAPDELLRAADNPVVLQSYDGHNKAVLKMLAATMPGPMETTARDLSKVSLEVSPLYEQTGGAAAGPYEVPAMSCNLYQATRAILTTTRERPAKAFTTYLPYELVRAAYRRTWRLAVTEKVTELTCDGMNAIIAMTNDTDDGGSNRFDRIPRMFNTSPVCALSTTVTGIREAVESLATKNDEAVAISGAGTVCAHHTPHVPLDGATFSDADSYGYENWEDTPTSTSQNTAFVLKTKFLMGLLKCFPKHTTDPVTFDFPANNKLAMIVKFPEQGIDVLTARFNDPELAKQANPAAAEDTTVGSNA